MKHNILLSSIIASTLLLSACDNAKSPTPENFKKAIQAHLEKQPKSEAFCLKVETVNSKFPANTLEEGEIGFIPDDPANMTLNKTISYVNALSEAKVLSFSRTIKDAGKSIYTDEYYEGYVYKINDEKTKDGLKIKHKPDSDFYYFCTGDKVFNGKLRVMPEREEGQKWHWVLYSYDVNKPEWAKSPKLEKINAYPDKGESSAQLELNDTGWFVTSDDDFTKGLF